MKIKKKAKRATPQPSLLDAPNTRNLHLLQGEFARLMHAVDDVKRYGMPGTHEVCARMLRNTYELIDMLRLETPDVRRPKAKR